MKKLMKFFLCVFLTSVSMASYSQENKESAKPDIKTSKKVNILIIYYSSSGTTEKIAKMLQEKTNGDIYQIKTNPSYETEQLGKEVALERESGNICELNGQLPMLSEYDLILIGGPVWSGEPSNPIQKYLSMINFDGKKVTGFWTANSVQGDYEKKFKTLVKNAELHNGLGLINSDITNETRLDSTMNIWLESLGI